jgi:N12 class adenine-specific DNA methylase
MHPSESLPELKGAIFLNPQTNRWETVDDYLSGHVRAKLAATEAAALADEQFAGNVGALKAVQPADRSATEIAARLGSTWIPAEDVQLFASQALNTVGITEVNGQFS